MKPLFHEPVRRRVGEYDPRLELFGVFEIHQRIGCDDDDVADLYLPGRGAVEADAAASAFSLDDVGLETLSVVDVQNLDLSPSMMLAASKSASSMVMLPT